MNAEVFYTMLNVVTNAMSTFVASGVKQQICMVRDKIDWISICVQTLSAIGTVAAAWVAVRLAKMQTDTIDIDTHLLGHVFKPIHESLLCILQVMVPEYQVDLSVEPVIG